MRVRILSLFLCGVLLTGCGSTAVAASTNVSSDTASLQAEIEALQTENESLKKQLASSTESTSSDISNKSTETDTISEEDEYIKDNLELKSAKVEKYTGYDGEHVGLGGVSIKNNGDKNIAKIYATVYFQDKNGKDIFDSEFIVVGNPYDYQGQSDLKANYSFKMEDNQYYTIDNLSDDVDITKYRVEISKIEFE